MAVTPPAASVDGPSSGQGPRERLFAKGPEALGDAELIALLLRTGGGGRNAVGVSEELLERYGGVGGLLAQDVRTLVRTRGLGEAKAAAVAAVRELCKRSELATLRRGPVVSGSSCVRRYLALHLGALEREVFGVMLLTTRHHLLGVENLFYGSVDRASVHSREVVKTCLRYNAAAVIMFHNHPSGVPEPSPTDIEMTGRIKPILAEIDVRLLDHVIVGGGAQVSMAERQLL